MPEERVTTGSEPKRTYDLRWSAVDGFRVSWDTTAQSFPKDGEVIRVVEGEPGHDERTEARKNIERMRELSEEVARLNAQLHGPWQPDPRTVKAVVEWLRDQGDGVGIGPNLRRNVAARIAERFSSEGTDG